MTSREDFAEDSTMRELHQIREELARQQEESGLSILEWLQATEKDFRKSLAADGFRMIKRNGRIFMYEVKSQSKNNVKSKTPKVQRQSIVQNFSSQPSKPAKHKSYDNYNESAAARELQLVREDRAASSKPEPQSKKQRVEYKSKAATKPGQTSSRKKPAK
ncbi:MAG: hypothetical protein ALAOOOJD_02563 [bacterium]|nr:hypothetical protein [bacterium]